MPDIMLVMAELQLDQLKSGGRRRKAARSGAALTSTRPPFGYRRVPRGAEGSGTLVPDPVAGPAVT